MEKYTKKDLIYNMLLNIKEGVTKSVKLFSSDKLDQKQLKEIFDILNENEAELVYILQNIKHKIGD